MHKLLDRQLKRTLAEEPRPELSPLLEAVDAAYRESDAERKLLERALELTSEELLERNDQLRAELVEKRRQDETRAALEESLRRSATMSALGNLVAGVAHEVRNPLFALSATLDAFEARHGGKEDFRPYIEAFRAEVQRLILLMRELLEYGKPADREQSPGALEPVLQKAVRVQEELARRSGVTLQLHLEGPLGPLLLDGERLLQVFENLLANALQFSQGGATVRLEAGRVLEEGGPAIVCRVLDAGPGFRPEDLPRVFEPFFTRRRGGTGLGLSIVQRIVEDHRGRVEAQNRPGGGACLVVRLPALAEERA